MSESPSLPRSKRQKIDRTGRFAALAKLKSMKESGSKNKYQLSEDVDNVYDTVDEREYSRRVLSRANEDWIEDDNGEGYVEDGREIFDDDEVDEEVSNVKGNKQRDASNKRTRDSEKKNETAKGKSSLKNLFSNAAMLKKKEPNSVNLAEDNVLAELLGEIKDDKKEKVTVKLVPSDEIKRQPTFTEAFEVTTGCRIDKTASDDEMIESILRSSPSVSTKNEESQMALKPNLQPIQEDIAEIEVNEYESANESVDIMDYSILENDENQFMLPGGGKANDNKKLVIDDKLTDNWAKMCQMEADQDDDMLNEIDTDQLSNDTEAKVWLWDAWEDSVKRPGEIFLFGKIQETGRQLKSITIHVENVDRCLYLLPRKYLSGTNTEVSMMDVHEEFSTKIVPKLDLEQFRSRKVSKFCAFHVPDVQIPQSSEYMQVEYEGKKPAPENRGKYKTIAHIFGTTNSSLETFLLERKIKGPCWLTVKNFTVRDRPLSWCQSEITCSGVKCIEVASDRSQNPPPLVLMALNVRVAMNPKTTKNEVVMISGLVHNRFASDKAAPVPQFNRHFCYFTKPTGTSWPFDINQKLQSASASSTGTKATKFNTERELLSFFLNQYQTIDPDLVVTHDADDCQLDIICDRIVALKIPMWSRIGRLRMANVMARNFFTGRMICDVKKSAEELIKSRSYDLDTLCQTILKLKDNERVNISHDQLMYMFQKSDDILKLISVTMLDATYILRLMCDMNVLPLALQITNICGNLMSRTLQGGRSKRNEYLLLHAFNEKNYIIPDRKVQDRSKADIGEATKTKKKAAYLGGLVLEPLKGFYDKFILLMDFNSLYPSIIQEYNICYTTIDAPEMDEDVAMPDPSIEQGVLPAQIRRLVESRRAVKKLMAVPEVDPDLMVQYNIRQLALKLTANSMYGCLGFDQSRFYAPHLAALVTQKGRDILMNTKSLVQNLNLEVIYGDTDSIMVNTNCKNYDQVFKIGHEIKQAVNKCYKHVELDIDGVFKYLLLLKKKKYAAVTVNRSKSGDLTYQQEHKGLDIVRRDWSQVSVTAGRVILDELLSDRQMDEKIDNVHAKLEKFRNSIRDGKTPMHLLTITKQLTKQPKEYPNAASLPHVQVALRMNDTMNKRYKKGDMVDYVICQDGTDKQPMQRAYHVEEIQANEKLQVDTEYYLSQQIHPVVSRICEPIEGTDASRIALCLGLDSTKFRVAVKRIENLEATTLAQSKADLYGQCEKFKFICRQCNMENVVQSPFKVHNGKVVSVLQCCAELKCAAVPYNYLTAIRNALTVQVRKFISQYYENYMICDEATCNNCTRVFTHVMVAGKKVVCDACGQGHLYPQYSATDLYNQLSYFQYVFDVKQHNNNGKIKLTADEQDAFDYLRESLDAILARSQYCTISLRQLFQPYHPIPDIEQLAEV